MMSRRKVTLLGASLYDTDRSTAFWIKNNDCRADDWRVVSASPWLQAAPVEGLEAGLAQLNYQAAGLAPGRYQALWDVYASRWDLEPSLTLSQEFLMTKLHVASGAPWVYGYGPGAGDWASQDARPRTVGDVNGDGLDDLVAFGASSVIVSISHGAGFEAPQTWSDAFTAQSGGWSSFDRSPRLLGDVSGDGMADIVGFGSLATYVSLSTGSSFGAATPWIAGYGHTAGGWDSQDAFPRALGDVNGDGKADVVGFGSRAVYVSLSTGNAFGPMMTWIRDYGTEAGGWISQNTLPRLLGDVNGDGMADIVGLGNNATYVSLSTGHSFGPATPWISAFGAAAGGWIDQETSPRVVGDVNGDGRADIVGFGSSATYLSLSTGNGFAAPQRWLDDYGASDDGWSGYDLYPRGLGDVNGDGRADVVGFGHVVTFVTLSSR